MRKSASLTLAGLALLLSAPAMAQPAALDARLKTFLQAYTTDAVNGPDKTTQVQVAQLHAQDGTAMIAVYLQGRMSCGSGGCDLLILEPSGDGFRTLGEVDVLWRPVRLLPTFSHGRPDLGVAVHDGGIRKPYEAVLHFDGKAYPQSPFLPGATALPPGDEQGQVVIGDTGKPEPLFP